MSIQPSPSKSAVDTPSAGPQVTAEQRLRRHVLEGAVAAVLVQPVGLRHVDLRRAVVAAAGEAGARLVGRDVPLHVVADVQIEPAVTVVVEKRRRDAPAGIVGPAGARDVGERPVAVVVEQLVRAEVGEVEIDAAVVVDVAAAAPIDSRGLDAALRRDVGEAERSAAVGPDLKIVAIETALWRRRTRDLQRCGTACPTAEQPSLWNEDVEIAVVVEIEQRRSRREDLGDEELPRRTVDVHEVEAGLFCPVGEPRLVGRRAVGRGAGRRDRLPPAARSECPEGQTERDR